MSDFKLICSKLFFRRLCLVYESRNWWWEFDFEIHGRLKLQHLRFSEWHTLNGATLPYRDRKGLYAKVPDFCWPYELLKALGVSNSLVSSYLSSVRCRGTEV